MIKAILVIDMPKKCYECPLMSEDMYCKAYANIVKGHKLCVEDDVLYGERNCGCPLMPLPIRDTEYRQAFEAGWQCCFDEIGDE